MDNRNSSAINFAKMEKVAKVSVIRSSQSPVPEKRKNQKGFLSGRGYKFILAILAMFFFGFSMAQEVLAGGSSPCSMTVPASGIVIRSASSLSDTTIGSGTAICTVNAPANGAVDNDCTTSGDGGLTQDTFYRFEMAVANSGGTDCTVDLSNHSALVNGLMSQLIASFGSCTAGDIGSTTAVACTQTGNGVFVTGSYSVPGGATRWAAYTFKTPTSNNTVNTTGYRHATSGATATSDTNNIQVLPDTIPPQWSNNWSRTAVTYSPLNFSVFNITWTDNIKVYPGGVLFESNFTGVNTNYTMQNTSNVYNYSAIYPAGVFYWKSYANDTSGNRNMTYNWTFIIARETTLLNLTLNGTAGNFTMEYGPSIYLNGSVYRGDNITIQLYRNSSLLISNYSQISNFSLFDLPGIFNITLVYLQSQNYTDARITYYINVTDRQPPNITLLAPENNGFDNDGNVNFRFNVTDASEIDSCRFFYVGYGPPIAQNFSVNKNLIQEFVQTGLDEDTYSWLVNCTDNRTNEGTSSVYTVTVDQTEPEVVLTTPLNASWDLDGSVQMSFTVADLNKNLCSLYANFTGIWHANQTDSAPDEGANSFNSTTISDGVYVWNVFCNDSATNLDWGGSTAALDENYTIYIDSISPQVNYSGPMPSTNQNTTVTTVVVNVTHFDANPDTVIFNFNGTLSYIRYTGTYTNLTYTGLQGHYQFNVSINDSAGHTNSTETRSIKIDNVAPRLYIESPGTVAYDTDGLAVFRFNATDQTLGIKNCSLYLDSGLASTNATVQQGVSQDFTQALLNGTYSWYISCSDYIPNINNSDARTLTVDTTSPYIRNETINATSFNVQGHACLIVFVNDSHSSISEVRIKVQKPSGLTDWLPLANSSTSCGLGGLNWSASFTNDESGTYYWNITNATDLAGNYFARSPPETITWTATSNYFLNVTLVQPLADFELNESSFMNNYSYLQTCNVSCSELSSGDCTGVVLKAEFNNESLSPSAWYPLTRNTTQLRGNVDNLSCGTLSNSGGYCNQTFNVTVGTAAGGNIYGLRCAAFSTNAGAETSELFVNLTINDYPVAAFTFPSNGSYLNGIEILNASASTDDQGVSLYTFELDNAADFANAYPLCSSALTNCTFNTSAQANCAEDSWNCFIRLNVTDSDGLKNSTTIQVMIDNTPPAVSLAWPANNYWFSTSTITLNYTATDTKLNACVLYLNESGSFISNETNSTVVNNTASSFTTTARDRTFAWNIFCNDSAGNGAFNSSNRTVNVDTAYPNISFTLGTEDNNTFFARNFIFINVTAADPNQANLTFFLYNSTSRLVNATAIYAWGLSNGTLNFSNLGIVDQAYYYNVTILDRAGNANTTGARKITLDNTAPQVGFGVGTAENNSYYSRGWIYANVSVNESNFANITFYLYNSAFSLVNATNYTSGIFFVNFTGLADSNEVYYYNVTVWDRVSFEASTVAYRITLDNIAPGVRLDGPGNRTLTSASIVLFNFTPSDSYLKNCSFYANFSGAFSQNLSNTTPTADVENTFVPTSINDGYYIWNVQCYDQAGNYAFNDSNYSIEIDTTYPSVFNLFAPSNNSYSINRTPYVNWSETAEAHFKNYTIIFSVHTDFSIYDFVYSAIGNISNHSFVIPLSNQLNDNSRYYWKVIAYDNVSQSRESNTTFTYTVDSWYPQIRLISPNNNTLQTTSNSFTAYYNVSDNFGVSSCYMVIDGVADASSSSIEVNTTLTLSTVLTNGQHNWSVNCTDYAGHTNSSSFRNITINVATPKLRFYETLPGTDTGITGDKNTAYPINLSDHMDGGANTISVAMSNGNSGTFWLVEAVLSNNSVYGPQGLYIPASSTIEFDGYFSSNRVENASWRLIKRNSTGDTTICQVVDDQAFSSSSSQRSARCTTGSSYIDILPSNEMVFDVRFYRDPTNGATVTHSWDPTTNSGFNISAYKLGNLAANLSGPLAMLSINQSLTFNATCNVSCTGGYCLGTVVTVQRNTSTSAWEAIDIDSGDPLILSGSTNPIGIGVVNVSQYVNFTLKANQYSTDNNIRCIATSDYSSSTGLYSTRIIVRDPDNPAIYLYSPENNSFDSSQAVRFHYTPSDNYNLSNCTLVVNGIANVTNFTITNNIVNNFSVSTLGDLNYTWSVNCTDSFGNSNESAFRILVVDRTLPNLTYSGGTATNNSFLAQDNVLINLSAYDLNQANLTFYLYNSTFEMVNTTVLYAFGQGNATLNFSRLAIINQAYYYNVTLVDRANNKNTTETRKITLDNTAPQIAFDTGTAANNSYYSRDWIYANVSITESNFANLTFYLYNSSLDLVNSTNYTSPAFFVNFTSLADANEDYYYNVTVFDRVGFENSTETRVITLDNTAPQIAFDTGTAANNSYYSRDWIYVNVSVNESNFANITFYLYNSAFSLVNATNYTSGIFFVNFTSLADSNEVYYYNVTVWDRVSFEASTVAYRITLDNIAPGVRLDGPGDNSWSPASQVDFYYTPSDTNIASCTLYHNASGSFAANETNSTVANGIQDTISISLPDGSWQWNVFCNDSAGNGAFNSSNRTVNVDTQNPNIDFDSGTAANNSYFNRNWIFVNVSVTEINYANITFYLYDSNFALVNATNYTTGTFYVNFTSLSDVNEAYHYNVTVWDKASKYNSTVARVITLDSLNPNVNYASPTPPDNTNQTQTSLVVNVTLSDANSNSVTLNFNGSLTTEAISVSYANFTIQGLGDGVYAYNVTANDSAGNSNTTLARTVRIDNTPPWLYPESPLNNSWIGNHSHPVVYKYNVTDAILSVSNCSLYVNGLLNQTNYSLAQATSLNFTQAMPSGYFNWSVSCSDALKNENYTGNRSLRVDLTYPVISDASINMTSLNITTYLCLNVTVTDTFSGVNATYAKILDPDGIYENVFMNETGTGSCGDADGNNVYWVAYKANKVGIFNWTATYANDTAGNINSSIAGLLFNSSSIATLTANMTFPLSNFQINESEDYQNYTYRQECRAYCNGNDGVQNCTEVYLYAQYNLSGAAADITTASSFLVNYNNSYYCGNLTEGDQGDYCAYNFTIRTSATAGMTAWKINCRAGSATIGTYTSFESINLTVNDHPNASFAYPKNSTWLHGVEILNGSDTTDDKPIIRYAFEIDDNAGFSSPGLVCDTADQNCTLNTLSQTQCENESYACYLRLNVTDSDWLENSTTTNIGIDNLPPRIVLGAPSNNTWSNESAVKINYTATDINLDTCTVYHNASGPFAANVSNGTVDSGVRDSISIPFPDGNFVWNVYCNDTETNAAFNATNRTLNVDTVYPSISFAGGTEANNTYFPRDYIFVNLSITESHFANLTFYLYNSTFELINLTVYRAVQLTGPTNASINFSYLEITNGVYYYNATMVDLANNINSTETRKITLDNTNPTVDYAGPTPIDNYNQSSTSFIVNVTHSETNPDKALLNFNGTQYLLSYAGASTNFTLAGITHGYYVYNVTVNDSAGNSAQTAGRVIRIDRIPPFISLEAPGNNTWKPANTTFYYNVTDDLLFPGNCSLVVNGTINETDYTISEQASQNFTMYNFAEGYYSWAINCTDTVDNQNNSIAYIFKIDRTGPVSILDRPSNFTNISANVYMLNATVTDGEVGVNTTIFEYSQNLGQSFQAACIDQDGSDSYNCSWDISSLPDSRLYQVRVRANDSFGTYGEYFTKYNITLDRAAPVITLLNPGNNSRDLDGTVLFRYNVTDVTSGIGNCSLIINNEVNATNYTVLGNNTNNFTIYLAEDVYNWSVNCTDTAGNVNSSVSYNLSVEPDRASPRVNLNLPLNNTISTITTINFYFNVTDALSEIANCSIFINHTLNQTDSTIAKNATQSFEVSGFNDNSYSWQINCTDNSSGYYNVGTSDLYNLTVSRATNLYVSVLSNKLLYEVDKSTGLGENATITVNVSDKFGNKLRANITADVIYLNTSNVPVIWWNVSYKYRTRVNITNSENLAQNWSRVLLANYTVNFTMDTATLIAAGKMQADGDDLRVAYWNNDTGNWTQLDRLVFGINSLYTSVWFKTIADIPINTSEIRYYIYYGNNSAGNPPANRSNVYFYYEGFDANTTSLYNLSKDFEDLSEDVAGTIQYDATNKWLNHSASGAFGKSIRKNIPLADSIIEVSHYYNDRNGLLNRMEVASKI